MPGEKRAESWRRLQGEFCDLLDLEAAARPERLAQLKAEDPALADELRAMLDAHGEPGRLDIEERLIDESPGKEQGLIGQRLGVYRIREEIGQGGMGTVYLAERTDGYEQEVALKILRWGLGGHEMKARFRRERQILARLSHPNIAQLLDGGVSEDGRPYLVMQRIRGQPITRFCDRSKLDITARLELFCTVCEAVDHAHRNLIVHRDLKPSNILVADAGDAPSGPSAPGAQPDPSQPGHVKLLDFGIAKLLSAEDEADMPGMTRSEMRLMTPEHAAPEQIRGEAVTTATDTYALGILLYELLAGARPFPATGMSRAELEERICDRPPTPPSLHIQRLLEDPERRQADECAAERATSPQKLKRRLRGDLDTIVARALAKEPSRRYDSAKELADDLRRHLRGEPVHARPDSISYRLGRFFTRYAWQSAAALTVVALLVAFALTTLQQSRALAKERDEARLERQTAEQVSDVLVELFELTDPTKTPDGRLLAAHELLDRHAGRVLDRLEPQPQVQARLRHILGRVHRAHSQFDRSRELLQEALEQRRRLSGPDDEATLAIEHDLAVLESRIGDRAQAEKRLRASLGAHRNLFGESHERVAQCLQDLAIVLEAGSEEKSVLLEKALEIRRELESEPGIQTASSLNDLAIARLDQQRYDEAIELLEQASDLVRDFLGDEHPHALTVQGNLASIYTRTGRLEEAITLERELLERKRAVFGPESVVVANALNNFGIALVNLGDWRQGEKNIRAGHAMWRRLVGPENQQTVNSARNLARVLELLDRPAEAMALLREAAAVELDKSPVEEPFLATQIAALEIHLDRPAAAAQALEKIVEDLEAALPDDDYRLVETRIRLAEAHLALDEPEKAEQLYRGVLEATEPSKNVQGRDAAPPRPNPRLVEATCGLARAHEARGETERARELFEACLDDYAGWGLAHPQTLAAAQRAAERVEGRGF